MRLLSICMQFVFQTIVFNLYSTSSRIGFVAYSPSALLFCCVYVYNFSVMCV